MEPLCSDAITVVRGWDYYRSATNISGGARFDMTDTAAWTIAVHRAFRRRKGPAGALTEAGRLLLFLLQGRQESARRRSRLGLIRLRLAYLSIASLLTFGQRAFLSFAGRAL
jgi:hypothetical protein